MTPAERKPAYAISATRMRALRGAKAPRTICGWCEGGTMTTVSIDGPVGLRWRSQNVTNNARDQDKIIKLLAGIPEAQGGKKGAWVTPPLSGPDKECPKFVADAIWEFQSFWKAKGVFRIIDGVVDPGMNTIKQMNDLNSAPLKTVPPEGQLDATACWAACYAWWLRATPDQKAVSQIEILGLGVVAGGMVNADGTVNVAGAMRFLAGRHAGWASKNILPAQLKEVLLASKLPRIPVLIAYRSSVMGGHMNVIHSYDDEKGELTVMDPWFPDPAVDQNYTFDKSTGFPVFISKRDGSPYKFRGTHAKRTRASYEGNTLSGRLLIFGDAPPPS
jgi:hypothetical protein